MNLIKKEAVDFVMLDKKKKPDGYGSFITEYTEGAVFKASIVKNDSVEARIAQANGIKNMYTIYTSKAINLENKDVVKRKSDGKIFRVTSDGYDMQTPESSAMDLRKVSAEEWEIPA